MNWFYQPLKPTAGNDKSGSFTATGGGIVNWSQSKGGTVASVFTGGGVETNAETTARNLAQLLTGGGVETSSLTTARNLAQLLTGGGVFNYTYEVGGAPALEGSFVLTGGGVMTSLAQKDGLRSQVLTGGGTVLTSLLAARYGASLLSAGGVLAYAETTNRQTDPDSTGGGIVGFLLGTHRLATVNLTGGGIVILQGGMDMPLTDLGGVMDAIATAITDADITERAYAYPAGSVSPPCAVVGYPETIEFDVTYNRGADRAEIPVYFLVGRVSEKAARDKLSSIITGATGIKEALDGNLGGVVMSLRVMDMRILNVSVSGIDYLAAQFNTEIYK